MQERLKIQSKLQRLREQCIRDYLSTKLESIASKEVVNDILTAFIQANNKEFLESVTESILEAKESSRRLRETIETMKKEQQIILNAEREKVKGQSKQQHYIEMTNLKEQVKIIKMNLQAEGHIYSNQIEALKNELKASQHINQQLRSIVNDKSEEIASITQRMAEMTLKIENMNKKLADDEQLIHKFKVEAIQTKRSHANEAIELKNMHSKQESELLTQLKGSSQCQINRLRLAHNESILELQSKLKKTQEQLNFCKSSSNRIANQSQNKQLINHQLTFQVQMIRESLAKTEHSLQKKSHKLQQTRIQLYAIKQQCTTLLIRAQSVEKKYEQSLIQHSHDTQKLKQTINTLENQIRVLSQSNTINEQKIQKRKIQFSDIVRKHTEQTSILYKQISNLQSQKRFFSQKLQNEIGANQSNQEEIKSLMKYNALQQQNLHKCQSQIKRIEEECRAQISTYQEAFRLNIVGIEEELASSNRESQQLRAQIKKIKKQLEIEQQKQGYYLLYIQQIAFLKNELSKKTYQVKRQKIMDLFEQILQKTKRLSHQNMLLRQIIGKQLYQFQQDVKQTVQLIIRQVKQVSIKCLYCQHENQYMKKVRSPIKDASWIDKTLPKTSMQKQHMGSIKRNLKSINQKYQMLQMQNQSFTNRIDSYINRN